MALKTKLIIIILTNLLLENQCTDDNQFQIDAFNADPSQQTEEDQEIEDEVQYSPNYAERTTAALEDDRLTTATTSTSDEELEREAHEPVETATEGETVASDDITVSLIDDVVYNTKDTEGYGNFTNSIDTPAKIDTTATQTPTTGAMDEEPAIRPLPEADEEVDPAGQRNPKTENDVKPDTEKRPYEPKPSPLPALSKSSTLKGWLEDSWVRPPAGILVPLRPMALNRALAVWNDLAVGGLNVSDIVIVGYDSNGVNWRSRHSLQTPSAGSDRAVSEALSKLLLKYQGVHTDSTSDGTMRALATAAKLVPYDSALFVVTDQRAGDPQRLPLALRALVEKRLKVYTIWTDPEHPSSESEEALQELRNISQHTEGEVLPYSLQVMDLENSSNLAAETELDQWKPLASKVHGRRGRVNIDMDADRLDTLLVRRGAGQAISLGVPVENGVSALRVFIEGAVEHAVLYPPNDAPQIDLYNATSVAAFSPASRTEGVMARDVYLVFPGARSDFDILSVLPASPTKPEDQNPLVGMWHLSLRCDTCDYRLCLYARAYLHFDVEPSTPDTLKFRVTGPVASVRESQLVDEYGVELAKLPFSYQPITGSGDSEELEPIVELVADVAIPPVKASKVYAKIVGRDLRGEPYIRLAGPLNQPEVRMGRSANIVFPDDLSQAEELNSRIYNSQQLTWNDSSASPSSRAISQVINQQGTLLTTVQIGLSTRLYGAPGDNLQLHFEVTNYREQSVGFRFGAVGELRFLTGINPRSQTVASGQTVNVIISVSIPANALVGSRDLVTFTAYGNEQVSISAYVYVSGATQADVWAPELRHTFQGTCLGRTGSDCAQHSWATTITARDALGGLLRLSSSPIGLIYDNTFVAGSRDEVIATYRATCCAPRILVTAVDAFGNANSYYIDISNYLNGAAIAAIVLGVLLTIALISLLIFLIYWCVKRRRESRELPSYNTRNVS